MKKPRRFTVIISSPSGEVSEEETTYLHTSYLYFLQERGYGVEVWEDTRYKARERLYRIVLRHENPEKYETEFCGRYRNYEGTILTF